MSTNPGMQLASMQRQWLKELGVGRWQLPEPAHELPVAQVASAASSAALSAVPSDAAVVATAPAPGHAVVSGRTAGAAQVVATGSHGNAPSARSGGENADMRADREQAGLTASGRVIKREITPVTTPRARQSDETAGQQARQEPLADNLEGLKQQVLACTACDLCKTRRQAVFGDGAEPPARWMVIGEAPGEQEDRQGSPFVGRAGQLLDAMLASVDLKRGREVFIANVIKCRPPANRNPRPEEIAACSPYLMRQIELLKPERILVLGRFAAHTLLQTEASIGSLRGKVHAWRGTGGQDIPLVVSYHPAYLLRSPHAKAAAWQDLRLATSVS